MVMTVAAALVRMFVAVQVLCVTRMVIFKMIVVVASARAVVAVFIADAVYINIIVVARVISTPISIAIVLPEVQSYCEIISIPVCVDRNLGLE